MLLESEESVKERKTLLAALRPKCACKSGCGPSRGCRGRKLRCSERRACQAKNLACSSIAGAEKPPCERQLAELQGRAAAIDEAPMLSDQARALSAQLRPEYSQLGRMPPFADTTDDALDAAGDIMSAASEQLGFARDQLGFTLGELGSASFDTPRAYGPHDLELRAPQQPPLFDD